MYMSQKLKFKISAQMTQIWLSYEGLKVYQQYWITLYIVHPMALKISPLDKLKTFICGQIWDLEKFKCKPKPKKPDYESQTVNRREVEIEMKTVQKTEDESEPLIEEENEVPAFLRLNKPKESNIDEN